MEGIHSMFYSRQEYKLIDSHLGFDPTPITLPRSPLNLPSGQIKVDTPSSLARTEAGRGSHARSWSVWTAPSPSQAFASLSSTPPPLPGPASWKVDPQTPEPPPSHPRTDSSTYYTALWGSPYDYQSPYQATSGRLYYRRVASEVSTDGSPTLHRRSRKAHSTTPGSAQACRTTHRRDQAGFSASRTLRRPLSGSATNKKERRPRYGLTEDWLKNNLNRHRVSERGRWWSDESDTQPVGSPDLEPSERGETWLESVEAIKQKRRFERRSSVANQSVPIKLISTTNPHYARRHRVQVSGITGKRPDIWEYDGNTTGRILRPTRMAAPRSTNSSSPSSSVPSDSRPSTDQPLPPHRPLFERTASEEPVFTVANNVHSPLSTPTGPSIGSTQSFQRSKKKVIWRGKACIIALPLEDGRTEDYRTSFLKPEDVAEIFAHWKRDGYNTDGFLLSSEGQSREIYPDPDDGKQEWQQGMYRVSIPDLQDWEAYVKQLNEEKLRALGVSFGDEEPLPRASSAMAFTCRQASPPTFALPMLPSLPSSSVGSAQGIHHLNLFHPSFRGSTNTGSLLASSDSPDFRYNGIPGEMHNSQETTLYGTQSFRPMLHMSQPQPTPPLQGTFPSEQSFATRNNSRGLFHALEPPPSLGPVVSPGSPSTSEIRQYHGHSGTDDLLTKMRYQQAQLQAQLHQQQHQQQQQLNPQSHTYITETHDLDESRLPRYVSQPVIASPAPQGHRHNLSETLQKEIDEAEYHLEESIRRQLDEEDDEVSDPIEGHRQISGISHFAAGKGFRAHASDLDTNPSITGTPEPSSQSANQQTSFTSGHRSKSSMSKLNVQAPEFRFEPRMATRSNAFSFLGNKSSSELNASRAFSPTQPPGHAKHTSGASLGTFGGVLNVDAPAFTPGISRKSTVPTLEFSFSTGGPSFQTVPSFVPSGSAPNDLAGSGPNDLAGSGRFRPEVVETGAEKIFGNIKFPEIIKPTRRSKAIPIIRPDSDQEVVQKDTEGQEDESGRITQADGRQKRMRRNDHDGDQVPLFATSRLETTVGTTESPATNVSDSVTRLRAGEKSATSLERAADQLKELIDDYQASDTSSLTEHHEPVDADGRPWEPYEFRDVVDAASFSSALPRTYVPTQAAAGSGFREDSEDSQSDLALQERATSAVLIDVFANGINSYADAIPNNLNGTQGLPVSPPLQFKCPPNPFPPAKPEQGLRGRSQLGSVEPLRPEQLVSRGQEPVSESEEVEGVTYLEPSFQEIDAVMKHLNEQDPDLGVERTGSPWKRSSPRRSSLPDQSGRIHQPLSATDLRSDELSSSPERQQQYQYLSGNGSDVNDSVDNESESANTTEIKSLGHQEHFRAPDNPQNVGSEARSRAHRLISPDNIPISDWDDAVSSVEETTLKSRSRFFDQRIDDLVGGAVQERLDPLEKRLATIQNAIENLSSRATSGQGRRSFSAETKHSDADDEDDIDEVLQSTIRSPLKERKYNKLKASLLEAIAAQQVAAPNVDALEFTKQLADLKASIRQVSNGTPGQIKTIIEEAVAKQMRGRSAPITHSQGSAAAEKLQLQISGLESMLKIADTRAEDELKARRAAEDALADSQRRLRHAEQEAAQQRESAEETERSLRTFHDERQQAMRHTALVEAAQKSLEVTVSELSEKNGALEGTLEEYRLSSIQWRAEIEESKNENKNLRRTVDTLKAQMEDSINGRHVLRTKFDRLQEDMALAAQDIAQDQSMWRRREEEHKGRHELLRARFEIEARTREELEVEIERLKVQEKDAIRLRISIEEMLKMNTMLEDTVNVLRQESREHQGTATRFERELHDARETAQIEVQRTRSAMAADIEAAKNQVNIIRVNFESEIARLQEQLKNAKHDADTARARHDLMLEEASESRSDALREAADAREAALQEHYRFHERTLEGLRAEHERALKHALEDKHRAEAHLQERLALSDEKMEHYREKVSHLEEKLEVARSAAYAAAQAAQSARCMASPPSVRPSISSARRSDIPEKISPQALRESILVLQEQLQEREGRIEKLEHELSQVDKDAPSKIKDRDMEISWLRELLGVRNDDLEDIIATLSQPTYDREAVRDAAIRLRANLQMEQQEKERAMAGGQAFPSLGAITNLASAPRALPLAAAAAWGNWRKSRDLSFGNISEIANGAFGVSETPSKSSSSAQSFLSGLMTPPSTNLRQTPPPPMGMPMALRPASADSRPLRQYGTPRQSLSRQEEKKRDVEAPSTPPLLRMGSYDQDAESRSFNMDRGRESGGQTAPERGESGDEPFGPSITA